ncbi:hypothetical protein I8H83_03205 [Candidatus Saccharibacteria bacterium]|nr:hypothetical protein [Candidatus Saccharibacteria bacterium]
MQHKLFRFHVHIYPWMYPWLELFALVLALFVFVFPASADMRFQERSLYIRNNEPGVTTDYTVSFRYMSPQAVGSVDMLFCNDPIPYHPCVPPAGLDVSGAVLNDQLGETGFAISVRSPNHLVLSRLSAPITDAMSSYTFTNIRNPTATEPAFSIRLRSHTTTDASGPQVDFGSVRGQIQSGVILQTQVPPMLIFCLAEEVEYNCGETNDNYYTDMGDLSPQDTLLAQSQMAVGTNASGGFAITANGGPPAAGASVINGLTSPTESRPGTNQFGINLVQNASPAVGKNPEGEWANAVANADYSQPNRYKYVSGDVIAYSPNVSLMKKFTVSYILNSSPSLRPGIYTTSINYVASGRF